jgi:hypothetical protein
MRQRTAASFPFLIKIDYYDPDSKSTKTLHYTNATENITYGADNYLAAAFSVQPPERDGAKIGDATLTISAIDQVLIEKIRATQIPAKLRFIAVIVYKEGSVAGIEPLEDNVFTLREARWDELSVSWSMRFDENMAIIITSVKCNAQTAPGCA